MSETAINLLMQIPLAGIVVIVVVLFLRYLEAADARNQAFIAAQRTANNEAVVSLAKELNLVAAEVSGLKTLLTQHDAMERAAAAGRQYGGRKGGGE